MRFRLQTKQIKGHLRQPLETRHLGQPNWDIAIKNQLGRRPIDTETGADTMTGLCRCGLILTMLISMLIFLPKITSKSTSKHHTRTSISDVDFDVDFGHKNQHRNQHSRETKFFYFFHCHFCHFFKFKQRCFFLT